MPPPVLAARCGAPGRLVARPARAQLGASASRPGPRQAVSARPAPRPRQPGRQRLQRDRRTGLAAGAPALELADAVLQGLELTVLEAEQPLLLPPAPVPERSRLAAVVALAAAGPGTGARQPARSGGTSCSRAGAPAPALAAPSPLLILPPHLGRRLPGCDMPASSLPRGTRRMAPRRSR